MSWWNPISWVHDAQSEVVKTIDAIKNWTIAHVRDGINALARDLGDWIGDLSSTVADVWREITRQAVFIWNRVNNVVAQIYRDAAGWVSDAERYADLGVAVFNRDVVQPIEREGKALYHDAEHYADVAVSDLRGAVVDFEHTALSWVNDLRGAVVDFEHTARTWVDDGIRQVERYADDGVRIFDRDVIRPLASLLSTVEHDAATALDFALHEGADAVHLVEKAWDWLELLATHALHDVEAIPGELVHALSPSSWMDILQRESIAAASTIGDFAAAVFS